MVQLPFEFLLAFLLLWPLLAGVAVGLRWLRSGAGSPVLSVAAAALTLGAATLLMAAEGGVSVSLPALLGAVELKADPASRAFSWIAAFVWFCSSVHAVDYLRCDRKAGRLRATILVLLSANLGVFLAGDWLTLVVCFEVLGLGSVLLVVHAGTEAARRATVKYFWMTLVGGLVLLAGIVLWNLASGSDAIAPLPDTALARWAITLVLIGFGVKAGMLGFHVWLPDAHSVAPPPASALLSGVMIKAGAYGIYRCLDTLSEAGATLALAAEFGSLVLGLGLAGMLIGAIAALGQPQAKRLLAWSSISQMGFILAVLAAAVLLGENGSGARTAGLMHALNHALFKSALFLAVGALVHAAGTGDLARLGGQLRNAPLLAVGLFIAVAAIIGLPGFNGFISKTLVHHALAELAHHDSRLVFAEWCYYAASAGTAAMFVRLIYSLMQPAPDESRLTPAIAFSMQVAVALPAVAILLIGLAPASTLAWLGGAGLSLDGDVHFSAPDFVAPFLLLAAGAMLFFLARFLGLLAWRPPAVLTIDAFYRALGRGSIRMCERIAARAGRTRAAFRTRLEGLYRETRRALQQHWTDWPRVVALGNALRMPGDTLYRRLDIHRDRIVARALALAEDHCANDARTGPSARERIQDSTRHYAGWLATRLLNAAMQLERDDAQRVVDASDSIDRLARCAVEMARIDVASGHETRALHLADEALDALLGPHTEATVASMPFRHWVHEARSVLFHLFTDPAQRHWPVSENLAHGAFASRLRSALHRLAADPGRGLALAMMLLVLIFTLIRG